MSSDVTDATGQESAGVLTAAGFTDDWYMNAYKVSSLENRSRSSQLLSSFSFGGWSWRKVALAGILGVFAGLGIASRQIGPATPTAKPVTALQSAELDSVLVPHPTPTIVHTTAPRVVAFRKGPVVQSDEDVARLKVRNRRLEALVRVLRQRPVEKKSVQEQTTFLGQ